MKFTLWTTKVVKKYDLNKCIAEIYAIFHRKILEKCIIYPINCEIVGVIQKLLQKDLEVCNICSIFAGDLKNVAGITNKPK